MARQTTINVKVNSTSAVKSIDTLKKAFESLNETVKKTTGKEGKIKLNIDLGGVDLKLLNDITKSLNKMSRAMGKLDEVSNKYAQNGQIFNVTSNQITNNITKTSSSAKNLSNSLVGTVATFEFFRRGAVGVLRDFSQLSDATYSVGIAGQMNISQIEKLNSSFLQLSTTVPSSARELAMAVDDLIRTGRSYEESRQIIEQVARLSTASGDSLKDTAQVVTKVMVALGISGDRTIETLNTMHSTAIQTASDMGYLAEAFKNIAGTASVLVKSSGLSGKALEDYKQEVLDLSMALTGSMANLGVSASSAGTKIKNMFSKISAGEKSARTLFDQAMRINNIKVDGNEVFNFDKLTELSRKDLPRAIELLSKWYTEGKLSTQVMQKMFTGRHFMEISDALIQINGDIDTFINGIASGVNYSADFSKNMLNINNQWKQFANNVQAFGQGGFAGEGFTGILLISNDFLKTLNKAQPILSKSISSITTLTGVVGMSALAFGTLQTSIMPLLKGSLLASLNPISLTVGAIAGTLYLIGESVIDTRKRVIDTNTDFDNTKLLTNSILKNINSIKGTYNVFKNNIQDLKSIDIISLDAVNILDMAIDKSEGLKEILEGLSNIKLYNAEDVKKIETSLENIVKEYESSYTDKIKSYKEAIQNSISDIAKRGMLIAGTSVSQKNIERLLNFYLDIQDIQPDVEKRMESLYKKASELGISKSSSDKLINTLNVSPIIKENRKALEEFSKEAELYAKNGLSNFSEYQKQITSNQEALNKFSSYYNKHLYDLFTKTGEIEIGGIEYKGFEGISAILKEGIVQNANEELNNIRLNIKALNKEKEEILKIDTSSSLYTQGQKRLNEIENEKRELYEKEKNSIKNLEIQEDISKNISSEQFKDMEYTKNTSKYALEILSIQLQRQQLISSSNWNEELEKSYKKVLDVLMKNIKYESEFEKQKQNATKYQIKYRNYLKETLDTELESVKIGKTKAEQEFLAYSYKLKQLKIEKEIAESEKETAKQSFANINISKEWMDRVSGISDAKSGQKVIDDFYKKYKNVLEGSEGKEQKAFYEALTVYVSAMSKEEALDKKISLEPLKSINEFLLGVPEAIQESLIGLQELANEGIIPFNNYGDRLVEQIEKQMSSNKERIWKAYGLDAKSLQEAIEKNMAQINLFDTMSTDDTFILSEFQKLRDKFSGNEEITKEIITLEEKGASVVEKKAFMMKLLNAEQDDLLNQKNLELALDKKSLENLKSKVKYLNSMGKLASSIGDIFGSDDISNFGKAFEGIGDFQVNMENLGNIDWSKALDFNTEELSKAFEGLFAGLQMGSTIGTAVGGITGGGQASQQGGALGGLLATGLGMTGWGAVGMAVGGSVLGGLFGDDGDDQAEAERRTKEANKIYNKNTEALQKLAQNMSNLSGGVDSLNNTLISAFSKIPTVDNISNVTDAMTQMYKTMDKTRRFEDVAYQVTKTKKSKGGLFGGGSTTSWTETIEVSVNEMLRRYGFKGALEDMTTQQIRDFSAWLDNYDLGDTDNFSILADALEDYAEGLDKFETNIQNFFRDTTMEAFSGISSLEQESLRQQIEDFYKNLGFQIDDEISKQIDKLAEEMSVMVTIMSDVRGEFVNQWRLTGQSAGSVFLKSMTPYLDAMMENISQVYYDVYFSGVNENLEKEFKNLSEQLIELKREGKDLDWSSVTDKLSDSFGNVLNTIISVRDETTSFNDILMELQKQALESGLSLSEIFDLGLMSGTQQDVMETFKDALLGGESDSALTSIGEMLGDKIGETMANRMIDNLLSDNILEFSAQIDKIMSGGLSFDSLAELSNQALSVGLMMQGEADRLSAIKELFDFQSDIEYTTQNENIEYQTGTSSQQVYNVYVNGTIEAGNIIESDSTERLLQAIIDDLIERLRVDKGIDITKLR